jgi:hypothetical protein
MLGVQRLIPRVPPPLAHALIQAFRFPAVSRWTFEKYLNIAPPEFASLPRVHAQAAADPEPAEAAVA